MNKKKKLHLINNEIKFNEVRVADNGIMTTNNALRLAESQDLDLVLINDKSTPPICKIMNYEKFIYENNKKQKNKSLDVKEIKVGPNTSENDVNYRLKHIIEFLNKGHKVKITMQFKGREMAYVKNGEILILKMIDSLTDYGVAEAMPKLEGKKLFAVLKPKPKN